MTTSTTPTETTGSGLAARRVFTVGHSDHEIEAFLSLLQGAGIQVVVDTRSQPYSRRVPQFDREGLRETLRAARIRYEFFGEQLGGRPREPDFYDEAGHVLYDRVAASERFLGGIARLEEGLGKGSRVALLCAEENPRHCHRRLLVARVLAARGVDVVHLRATGKLEPEAQVLAEEQHEREHGQGTLFGQTAETPWRSTRSVSPRSPQSSSLKH